MRRRAKPEIKKEVGICKTQNFLFFDQNLLVLNAWSHSIYFVNKFKPLFFQIKLTPLFELRLLELPQQATAQGELKLLFEH